MAGAATVPAARANVPGSMPCDLKIADAVWVGTALLHEQFPKANDFPVKQIVDWVIQHHLTEGDDKSIYFHVNQHCVANRRKHSNRSCVLYETSHGNRRLFRPGDQRHEERMGAPTHPKWDVLPARYAYLRHWYEEWVASFMSVASDPLLNLTGTWKYDTADTYVAKLRENWEPSR